MIAYFYDSDGRVVQKSTGQIEGLQIDIENSPYDAVMTEDDHPFDGVYVKNGELLLKGDQPSPDHVFDYAQGQWVFDLSYAKELKWSDIKAARDAQEFGTFDWGGYTFQCDEVSQRRIQGAVQLAAIDPDMTLEWTLANNQSQVFAGAEYVAIGQALAVHVSECHARGRMLREQINQASTQSDLEAIVW